jgi:hypothetical protein
VDEHFTSRRVLSTFWRIMIGGSMTTKATITAALAALLLTASCGGKPEVLEPDATSTPSSVTPSTVTPPTKPAAAQAGTTSGAGSFVRYWIDTFNFAAMTGETEQLAKISRRCPPCRAYVKDFATMTPEARPSEEPWVPKEYKVATNDRGDIRILVTVEVLQEDRPRTLAFDVAPGTTDVVRDIKEIQ